MSVVTVDYLRIAPLQDPVGDFREKAVLDMVINEVADVDVVYHLASHKSVPESFHRPLDYLDNMRSTMHLLEICSAARVPRVIVGSTCEVYGQAGELPNREDSSLAPRSPYAASKVAVEMAARAHQHHDDGTEVMVARLFNVFGPGERADALVPALCRSALVDRALVVEGGGEQRRDLSYIDDTVSKLESMGTSVYAPVLNLGSGRSWSVREIVDMVSELAPGVSVTNADERPNEIREFVAHTAAATEALGEQSPCTDVPAGVRITFNWWVDRLKCVPDPRLANEYQQHEMEV